MNQNILEVAAGQPLLKFKTQNSKVC